jgi:multiple sugar transport system substrate-binding protein
VNVNTFEKLGLPLPPSRWTFEQFERQGKAFVAAANVGKDRQDSFFCDVMPLQIMHRTLGLSVFNETLTACSLDDPRYIRCLNLKYKWMYIDRLLPTQADVISFGTQAGYGGSRLQLFNRGQYGMVVMGRYALIQLRRFGALDLAVVEPPHGGFPTTLAATRCASVYVGSDHRLPAVYFLSFLASEKYTMQIVRDADALPPNPRYTAVEPFLRPPDHPNEWAVHGAFADAAGNIGIGGVYSPFVPSSVVTRSLIQVEDAFLNDQLTAAMAAARAQQVINQEIQRTLAEDASLRPLYEKLSADQREIDRLRAAGRPVPLELIRNPFYRRYYAAMGWTK